jgi:probable phosphoglycerate mutase
MFVIVRHGNTFAADEAPRRIGARTDLPLTESGRRQAEALGAHFAKKGWRFGRVLVSPLSRTYETAGLILALQASPPAPEVCDWLREIDHGPDENRREEEVVARIGHEALSAWDVRAEPPPGWIVDPAARETAWRDLFAEPPQALPTLIVTSNGAARFALSGSGLAATLPGFASLKLPTGSYGVICREEDGTLRLSEWGRRP